VHRARIAHHIPGRLRLLVATARRDLGFLVRAAGEIEQLADVHRVEVNPVTGSLVIHYEDSRHDELPASVRALGLGLELFELALDEPFGLEATRARIDKRGSELGRELLALGKLLNRELKLATGGTLDFRLIVPLGAAGITALNRQYANGPTPLWMTLLTFAFNSFVALHRGVPIELDHAVHRPRA
jgi:hypothetical protein